jgi:di/tricarboxylate transporter
MSADAWITLVVVVVTVFLLAREHLSPPLALLGAVTFLLVIGVIDADEAFSGFSNAAPITVAALYVVAAGVEKSRALELVAWRLLPTKAAGERSDLARVLVPTASASAFLNNTPIVAMVAPTVLAWARRTGRSPSRYLIPVSFAAIVGGVITLIGTSTNLVVSGLLEDSGEEPLGLFEQAKVGLPIAIAGIALLIFVAPRLLPVRRAPSEHVDEDTREFTVEMIVAERSPLAGKSVFEAGLRSLEGVFLVEIERAGHRIAPVAPDELLSSGDRLIFVGNVSRIIDLQQRPGLESAQERHFRAAGAGDGARLFEAVIGESSPLVGSTLKQLDFRSRYAAAVVAIHRAGERMPGKLGDVALEPGDVLVVLSDAGFRARTLGPRDFLVVAPLDGDAALRKEKAPIVGLVIAGLLVAAGTGLLDILPAALVAAFAMIAFRVLTPTEARDSVDIDVIVVIAASFGLGAAMLETGLADELASVLIGPLGDVGDLGLLFGVLIATILLTEIITNNAAAVLIFPIALATAADAGLDPRPFAIAIAIGASCSFLTPIGYQTNTMVYGMGGYRFGDFARVGLPLTLLMVVMTMLIVPIAWPLD